ncbi:MAG: hypothetical protein HY884_06705 [Deltaproteobacteria bacterium]|nr:hypothetical protein [Deltaproteobacteria bacterium]
MSIEYEEVYLKSRETVAEAGESLARYFHFHDTDRLHESLGYRTPREVYFKEGRLREDSETKSAQAGLHQIQPSFLS